MGKERKYAGEKRSVFARGERTARRLNKCARLYFDSISRLVPLTEPVEGEKDEKGKPTFERAAVHNLLGEQIQRLEYVVPPTIGGLCAYLGVSRDEWSEFRDPAVHPEYRETVRYVRDRILAFHEEELLTRKDIKGLLVDMQTREKEDEALDALPEGFDGLSLAEKGELLSSMAALLPRTGEEG